MASTVSCGYPTSLLPAQDMGYVPIGRVVDTVANVGRDTLERTARRLSDDSGRDNVQIPSYHEQSYHLMPIIVSELVQSITYHRKLITVLF